VISIHQCYATDRPTDRQTDDVLESNDNKHQRIHCCNRLTATRCTKSIIITAQKHVSSATESAGIFDCGRRQQRRSLLGIPCLRLTCMPNEQRRLNHAIWSQPAIVLHRPSPSGEQRRSIVISVFVCLSVRENISGTACLNFAMHACLWSLQCTSGFVRGFMFSYQIAALRCGSRVVH